MTPCPGDVIGCLRARRATSPPALPLGNAGTTASRPHSSVRFPDQGEKSEIFIPLTDVPMSKALSGNLLPIRPRNRECAQSKTQE
ncbi:hypothetical protein EYF80_064325 [Liparis tanakae]|uniref:Uncharacterized protein n=1 Tax=Liparis tanakae TaxID=230148 RepID=A0A4Z2E9V1_9TELE|nr:hypothetical protein EYF80_064325 [Liparis tanakae]